MEQIPVLIVDERPLARVGLRYLLETSPRFRVVGEAAPGCEAIEAVRDLGPRVVLMGVTTRKTDELEATAHIKEQFPQVSVVVVAADEDEGPVCQAILAGASGYLPMCASRDEICQAVESASRGDATIKASLLQKVVQSLRTTREWNYADLPPPLRPGGRDRSGGLRPADRKDTPGARGSTGAVQVVLTMREMSVLRLVALGKRNKEIGAELCISQWTAKKYVESILSKLGASDRTRAAVKSVELGLL